MNFSLIFKLIGNVLRIEALLLLAPLLVTFIYGENLIPFGASVLICFVVGTLLSLLNPRDKKFRSKEGFVAVALTWFFLSLFGAFPFYLSGYFNSFLDSVFESVSGFTTTGSTLLINVELLPRGFLFWRSFSTWIGGMGFLVFMLAIMPSVSPSSFNLLKAESPGPTPSKIVPKIRETAKIMYIMYLSMTLLLLMLLLLNGLPFYDAIIHTFSTAGTGGFSNMNLSVGAYNNGAVESIISIFMLLFATNFTLHFYLFKKDFKSFFGDEELRLLFGIVLISVVIITVNTTGIYGSTRTALRHSVFQVASMVSTSGFTTVDYNLWPELSRSILMFIMVIGGAAGSTSGGIKIIRILLLSKSVKNELHKIIHPRIVKTVKISGKRVEASVIMQVFMFVSIYAAIFLVSSIIISIDNKDMETSFSAVIASLSNIGPGFGLVGPMGNYSSFSSLSKIVLCFCMLAGRLEFFPVLVLFMPSVWKKGAAN